MIHVQMDLSLVDTDLVGACGLGDPRLPIFDDQVVCAAGHAVYSELLIFCEIEGFDYFSIDGNFNDLRRAFMHQFCPEKKEGTAALRITAIRIISCFLKVSVSYLCFLS